MKPRNDDAARKLAVDPAQSVLVQAPAGSGKTTLLVRRFLRLLQTVEAPEEILAVTFTRKAAASMRERILHYLRMTEPPSEAHERELFEDAQAVRQKVRAWSLAENPSRLRIMTIDSFCTMLVRQMPVLSGLGQMPRLADYPVSAYREAARRTMLALEHGDEFSDEVSVLLGWRDNDTRSIEDLLVALLPMREKWLRVLGASGVPDRDEVESVLEDLVREELAATSEALSSALDQVGFSGQELMSLAAFAASNSDPESPVAACTGWNDLPDADPSTVDVWAGLAKFLLTDKGKVRGRVTKSEGFPAKTPEKERMVSLIEGLSSVGEEAVARLHAARNLPAPSYSDDEWGALSAVVQVLQRAALELQVVFAESGEMDFSGMASSAVRGLGGPDNPTDLALYLDHAIRHILMDECQDSNWTQYQLLEKLTAGWEPEDGRTLFLVGDPMQSIYAFREAQPHIFLKVRDEGVGDIQLKFAQLTRNFRSRQEIVEWVNDSVGPAFPADDDQITGQIKYARSEPALAGGGDVVVEASVNRTRGDEAVILADHIQEALAREPEDYDIAVLVRARSHLNHLLPVLRERGIPFSSLQLDHLLDRPVVQDLHALTRALWHPADRISWLAVLRAPWCGLTLADLLALVEDHPKGSLLPVMKDPAVLARLSDDGRERLERVTGVIGRANEEIARWPMRDVVEGCWLALGGSNLYAEPEALRDAYRYLALVDSFDDAGRIIDWSAFQSALEKQRSEGSRERTRVQVMTIHEAKGLEFDMVILPGLERPPKTPDRQLLEWLPLGSADREALLLAPLRSANTDKNGPLAKLIGQYQAEMSSAERKRLLYVAATRAKQRLVVSASAARSKDGPRCSYQTSMLSDLWTVLAPQFTDVELPDEAPEPSGDGTQLDQTLVRVASGWRPECPAAVEWSPMFPSRSPDVAIEYDWAGNRARQIGRVMHRLLEVIGNAGLESFSESGLNALRRRIPLLLQREGIGNHDDIEQARERLERALDNTLEDERGRWLLSAHEESACEMPVGGVLNDEMISAVVDRTFVHDGERWIIDWKGGYHGGGGLDEFLASEANRHKEQLIRYARIFSQFDGRRIRLGLYLPMHGAWVEVPFDEHRSENHVA